MSEPPDEVSPWATPPRPHPAPPPPPGSAADPYADTSVRGRAGQTPDTLPGSEPGPQPGSRPDQPPPSPPPGPPRRTRLLAATVALVVVVLLAAGAAVVLLGRGDGAAPPGPTPSRSSADDDETDATDQPPGDGAVVAGTGYRYRLPGPGWRDLTAERSQLPGGAALDTAVVLGRSFEVAQSNVVTESLPAAGATDVEDVAPLFRRNLASDDGAVPRVLADGSLDGERALGFRTERTNDAGLDIVQVSYLAIHDGRQFSVNLTYPATGDDVSLPDFDELTASWTWDQGGS